MASIASAFYDGQWIVTHSNAFPLQNGAFSGNGKLGFYVSTSNIQTTRTCMSSSSILGKIGAYSTNTVNVFDTNAFSICHPSQRFAEDPCKYDIVHQTLDMSTGTVSSRFNVISKSSGDMFASVTSTMTALRQYPYCVLHELQVTPCNAAIRQHAVNSNSYVDVYHEITSSPEHISSPSFYNTTLYNDYLDNTNKSITIFGASGISTRQADCTIACVSSYISASFSNVGFNMNADRTAAFQMLRFYNVSPGSNLRITMLSSQMLSLDGFPKPTEEVTRMLMNIVHNEEVHGVNHIKDMNRTLWQRSWDADILVVPREQSDFDEGDYDSVNYEMANLARMSLRLNMFYVFACVHEVTNSELNALSMSFIDENGHAFMENGDLWLIPMLIFFKPKTARMMLGFRHKSLLRALQLASSYGYNGAKYPTSSDVLGYRSVYWDIASPMRIFNTCLNVINIWNYYRITLDIAWLQNYGFEMMRESIEFVLSFAPPPNYVFRNVAGIGNVSSPVNHSFTMYVTIAAIQHATEAAYTLSIAPSRSWIDALIAWRRFMNLEPNNTEGLIVRFDGESGLVSPDNLDKQNHVLDNLLILNALFSSFLYTKYEPISISSFINANVNHYIAGLHGTLQHPVNNIAHMGIFASGAQTFVKSSIPSSASSSYVANFASLLERIIKNDMRGAWGFINVRRDPATGIDIAMHSAIVITFLTSLMSVTLKGSVSPANIIADPFRVQVDEVRGVNMPPSWKSVIIRGLTSPDKRYIAYLNIPNPVLRYALPTIVTVPISCLLELEMPGQIINQTMISIPFSTNGGASCVTRFMLTSLGAVILEADATLVIQVVNSGNVVVSFPSSDISFVVMQDVSVNTWYNLVIVIDTNRRKLLTYVGQQITQIHTLPYHGDFLSDAKFLAGHLNAFNGSVGSTSRMYVYDRPLTHTEIMLTKLSS